MGTNYDAKSWLFRRAHELTRQTMRPGDDYQATFGECLRHLLRADARSRQPTQPTAFYLAVSFMLLLSLAITVYGALALAVAHDVLSHGAALGVGTIFAITIIMTARGEFLHEH